MKAYITEAQYVAANAPDVLEAKQEYFHKARNRKRGRMSATQLLVDWYYGKKPSYEGIHRVLVCEAQMLRMGHDINTGIRHGVNMLFVKL